MEFIACRFDQVHLKKFKNQKKLKKRFLILALALHSVEELCQPCNIVSCPEHLRLFPTGGLLGTKYLWMSKTYVLYWRLLARGKIKFKI
jgi:hypothetical protein